MAVAIAAWIFTIVCIILVVFFGLRAYRGYKQYQRDENIRTVIFTQEAANLAAEAKKRREEQERLNPPSLDESIPDVIPEKERKTGTDSATDAV